MSYYSGKRFYPKPTQVSGTTILDIGQVLHHPPSPPRENYTLINQVHLLKCARPSKYCTVPKANCLLEHFSLDAVGAQVFKLEDLITCEGKVLGARLGSWGVGLLMRTLVSIFHADLNGHIVKTTYHYRTG